MVLVSDEEEFSRLAPSFSGSGEESDPIVVMRRLSIHGKVTFVGEGRRGQETACVFSLEHLTFVFVRSE